MFGDPPTTIMRQKGKSVDISVNTMFKDVPADDHVYNQIHADIVLDQDLRS